MLVHDSQATLIQLHAVPLPGGEQPALDREMFESLRSTLPASALQEIFAVFLADTRKRLALLDESRASDSLLQVVHSIRGSAGMIGAIAIAALAERLECEPDARSRMLAACEQLQATLRSEGLSL